MDPLDGVGDLGSPVRSPVGPENKPRAEVDIDVALVRALLAEQHPDLADWSLRLVAEGWDNAMYRLGDDLVVRLPRRVAAVVLVEHEQRWLPSLAKRLPLPIPAPLRVGRPGCGYPWPWSVCPWLPGRTALATPPVDRTEAARTLGRFLAALHRPAPPDAPPNPYRGVPLRERSAVTETRVDQLEGLIDGPAVLDRWHMLAAAPLWPHEPRWLHGDLHPQNLLVHEGRLSAVIDFGDLTSGDPASDLSAAWMLFDPSDRMVFRAAVGGGDGIDDDTWTRAQGWALTLAVAYLASSADAPAFAAFAQAVIAAVMADPSS